MKSAVLLVSLLLLASVSGPSRSDNTSGPGSAPCGVWVKEQRAVDKAPVYWLLHGWVAGFVSGTGYAGDALSKPNAEGLDVFITKYCIRSPLKKISDGAKQLVIELDKQ